MKKLIIVLIILFSASVLNAYTTPDGVCGFTSSHTVQVKQYNITDSNLDVAYTATGVSEQAGVSKSCYLYTFTLTGGKAYMLCMKDTTVSPNKEQCWTVPSYQTSVDALITSRGTGTSTFNPASDTVTVGTNNDKTGYTASTVSDKTGYTVSTVSDKTGYTATCATVSDKTGYTVSTVSDKTGYTATCSTVSDKTGYSLSTAPPTKEEIRTELDSNSTQLSGIKGATDKVDGLIENVNGNRFTSKALEQASHDVTLASSQPNYPAAKSTDAMMLGSEYDACKNLSGMLEISGQAYRFTSGALEQGPSGGGGSGACAGSGDTAVDHNTGGTDHLRYMYQGTGIDNATIKIYLKTDYDAGRTGESYVKARSITKADGRWQYPVYLDSGFAYSIVFYKQGQYGPTKVEVTL